MLNICPLLNMDNLGRLIPREKIRSKKKVINAIVDKMAANAFDGLDYAGKCYISQSACYDDARAVADLIEARFPKLNEMCIRDRCSDKDIIYYLGGGMIGWKMKK